jgi:hypothetical protein
MPVKSPDYEACTCSLCGGGIIALGAQPADAEAWTLGQIAAGIAHRD